MIRIMHVTLPEGLNALVRRGPDDELNVYVSSGLQPDRQREAVRVALRASRRSGWRGLLPLPLGGMLLASAWSWLRKAVRTLRTHTVAWGTAAAVVAAAVVGVYLTVPRPHSAGGNAQPPAAGASVPPGHSSSPHAAHHTGSPAPAVSGPGPGPSPRTAPNPLATGSPRPVPVPTATSTPSTSPTPAPSTSPTPVPSISPTPVPSVSPTPKPSPSPTPSPPPKKKKKRHCITVLGIRICIG
jgi:outer membrane biosynthesis protein TonB